MSQRQVRIGVIVPSSNTVMEPMINRILADLNTSSPCHVTAYYTRVRVTQISNDGNAASQFALETMLETAALLADARVEVIVWGGTSAGWLGLDTDKKLCEAIESRYSIPAHTSTLALVDLVNHASGARGLGLVTPYKPELNEAIRRNLASSNVTVAPFDTCLRITDNHAISRTSKGQLTSMVDEVLSKNPDISMITVFCTNLGAADLAKQWESTYSEKNLVVLDSISTTVYGALKRANVQMHGYMASEWGSMFDVEY